MKKILILILLVLSISLCIETPSEPSEKEEGTLQLKITDKVENISSLVLDISEIKVHKVLVGEVEPTVNETNETRKQYNGK